MKIEKLTIWCTKCGHSFESTNENSDWSFACPNCLAEHSLKILEKRKPVWDLCESQPQAAASASEALAEQDGDEEAIIFLGVCSIIVFALVIFAVIACK